MAALTAQDSSAPFGVRVTAPLDSRMAIAAAMYVDAGCKPGSYSEIAAALDVTYDAVRQMFRRPRMQAHLRHLLTQRFNQLELSSERVMHELATIAFIKVSDLYDESGDLYAPHMLPDHVAAAVSAIEVEKRIEGRRGPRTEDDPDGESFAEEVVTKKYKFHSKNDALRTLATHFKIIGGADEGVNALASALADKLKAARGRITPTPEQPISDATIVEQSDTVVPSTTPISPEIDDEEPIW
jgi:terminase small subunit-like protein